MIKMMNRLLFCLFLLTQNISLAQSQELFKPIKLHESQILSVTQISENAFVHISYLQTNDFGNVPCNGLIVRSNNEVIIFDTPTNDKSAEELIQWINEVLHCSIKAIIPTHSHDDCLGGLHAFQEASIPSYANYKTIKLAKKNHVAVPANAFRDSIVLNVGKEHVVVTFFGEGHTTDNVVGYFQSENILFGGCLIKELNATKGYLGDANTNVWSNTVSKIKSTYPNLKHVVPGHGEVGGLDLLDYTMTLFKQ